MFARLKDTELDNVWSIATLDTPFFDRRLLDVGQILFGLVDR
jgi:hypothetical protein